MADSTQTLTATDLITLSASELAGRIRRGEVTSVAATEAAIARIEAVNPAINALVFPAFAEARAAARAADVALARGDVVGPLHGVPITIKDQFDVKGMPSTWGVKARAHTMAEADGPIVARLRAAGGIILGKTNIPQLLFYAESDNPLYGQAKNPWDTSRTPGGSSGGEGAILAAGGSFFGMGADIGGSLRVPAHFCGIATIKPTSGRLTGLDNPRYFDLGQEAVLAQSGPMARTVADVVLGYQIMAAPGQEEFDVTVPPVPVSDPSLVNLGNLRIGYYVDDGYFPASPAVRRATLEAVQTLRDLGVTVVEWTPPDVQKGMDLFVALLGADGGQGQRKTLAGEKPVPQLAALFQAADLPNALRPLVQAAMRASGQLRTAHTVEILKPRSTQEFWDLCMERTRYRARFSDAMTAAGIDAILCPPHALPALRHGATIDIAFAASYSMLYNLLGMPAGVVPVTRVRANEESDRKVTHDRQDKVAFQTEKGSAGLPIGVQVVARHWREDVVLALMAAIEQQVSKQEAYPGRFLPRG